MPINTLTSNLCLEASENTALRDISSIPGTEETSATGGYLFCSPTHVINDFILKSIY